MTATELRAKYEAEYIDPKTGRPWLGKFEGEPLYVPYFWNLAMEGAGDEEWDEDDTLITTLEVDDLDREAFPELGCAKSVILWESEQGFVYHNLVESSPSPVRKAEVRS